MESFGDIVEREVVDEPVAPVAPSGSAGGKNGPARTSRFKKTWNRRETVPEPKKDDKPRVKSRAEQAFSKDSELSEREKIHLENIEKMTKMSEDEIAQEKEELLRTLDPGVLQALLRRVEKAEIKDSTGWDEQPVVEKDKVGESKGETIYIDGNEFTVQDDDNSSDEHEHEHDGVHFPKPSQPSQPSEATNETDFLESLHSKYYPDLEVEEDKLAWMRPVSAKEDSEEYSEYQDSVAPSELRFDFEGNLITPRQSRQIDTNLGLHHHGDAPLAAGYTVAELAHLARSTNYSQRCIAIRTLGRILYRLGKLEYGKEISAGLYGIVEHSRVNDTLLEAADENQTRSVAVRTYATEALWLWKGQGTNIRPAV